jgi:sirohydrochlorin cobaltochelatase
MFAGVYPALPEGNYIIWTHPSHEVTVVGGSVAEVDLRGVSDIYVAPMHAHLYGQDAPGGRARDILPPRYKNGKTVSAAPMGSAPMRYTEEGKVAWNEMWTNFCDLALAGGPSHRDTLLEPADPHGVKANLVAYERVVEEIERGLYLVTGLPTVRSEKLGWVGLKCENEEMALWLLRAIVVENICVRREGEVLFLPAGPDFRLEKEIKNVITVVAKTHHYWMEHLL